MSLTRAPRPFEARWRRVLQCPGGRLAGSAGLVLLTAVALAAVLEPHWRQATSLLDAQRPAATMDAAHSAAAQPAWPPATAHSSRVSALLGLARRHDVRVRGLREDAAPASAEGGVAWRTVTLGAEGRYAALRRFAGTALAADEALALDSAVLQRADASQGLLRADFGFAFGHVAVPPAASGGLADGRRSGAPRGSP
jgi:hypothetical protein